MISKDQITKASAATGLVVENLNELAAACDVAAFPFFMGLSIIEKESHGHNVYGHDVNGALAGYSKPVDESNYNVFRWLVDSKGMTSNGVGPMQLTFTGFFTDMTAKGLRPWIAAENILYAVNYILAPKFKSARTSKKDRQAFWDAAKSYNGNASYADDALVKADAWVNRVGTADTLAVWTSS